MPSQAISRIVSITNLTRARTLNAIPPSQPNEAAARTARHMGMCAELAELAMQLARAAAARALADLAEPEQPPAEPLVEPAVAAVQPAPAAPGRRIAAPYLRAPTCKPTDPALLFTRLAATVRDCIALESRLAAGLPASAAKAPLRNDPRRADLLDAFHLVTRNHPDRTARRRDCETRMDEELAADPDQSHTLFDLLYNICDELDIELDLAKLPDKYLGPEPNDSG